MEKSYFEQGDGFENKERMMKVTVIIYMVDELEGLKAIMPRIKREWYDQLFIIDGGSTGGSREYLEANGYDVYLQPEGEWWSGAYREAHKQATGDIIIDLAADGNSVPEVIPDLVAKMREGYDMVTASRYTAGAKSEDDTLLSGLANFLLTALINLLFRTTYTDTLNIYRAYRKTLLAEIGLDKKVAHPFPPQLCIRCAKYGKRTADIPGDEPKRIKGESKVAKFEALFLILGMMLSEFLRFHRK